MFDYRVKDGWGEIRFSEKPDADARRALRDYGFAWEPFYRVWRRQGIAVDAMQRFCKWLSAEMRGVSDYGQGSVYGGVVVQCTF